MSSYEQERGRICVTLVVGFEDACRVEQGCTRFAWQTQCQGMVIFFYWTFRYAIIPYCWEKDAQSVMKSLD